MYHCVGVEAMPHLDCVLILANRPIGSALDHRMLRRTRFCDARTNAPHALVEAQQVFHGNSGPVFQSRAKPPRRFQILTRFGRGLTPQPEYRRADIGVVDGPIDRALYRPPLTINESL